MRMIVPRLPGSLTPSKARQSALESAARVAISACEEADGIANTASAGEGLLSRLIRLMVFWSTACAAG